MCSPPHVTIFLPSSDTPSPLSTLFPIEGPPPLYSLFHRETPPNHYVSMAEVDENGTQPLLSDPTPAITPSDAPEAPPGPPVGGDAAAVPDPPTGCRRALGVELSAWLYVINVILGMTATQQYLYVQIARELNYTGPIPGEPQTDNCTEANPDDPLYMAQQYVQQQAAAWFTYASLCSTLPAFLATVFLGGYSDSAGRKVALASPLLGSLCSSFILIIVSAFDLPKYVILVGSTLEGLSGYSTTFLMASYSYVTDTSDFSQRSLRIILLETVVGLAIFVANLSSGFLIVGIGFRGVYFVLFSIGVINILYVIFVLNESKIPLATTLLSCDQFTKTFYIFRHTEKRQPYYIFMLLLGLSTLIPVSMVTLGKLGVQSLYFFNTPFCWSSILLGVFAAVSFLLYALGAIGATKLFQKRIGDVNLLVLGMVSMIFNNITIGLARDTLVAFISTLIGVFAALPIGMLRSFLSKLVGPSEVGAMFSWVAWTESIGGLIGSIVFNSIYHATIFWLNSFVFYLMAAAAGVGLILAWLLHWTARQSKRAMESKPHSGWSGKYGTVSTTG